MRKTFRTIFTIFLLMMVLLTLATAFYSFMTGATLYEGFMNALSRIVGVSDSGQLGTNIVSLFFTLIAASALYYLINYIIELFVNIDLKEVFLMDKIRRLKDHYIVCGAGRVGLNVAKRLDELEKDFVIIEREAEVANEMRDRYGFLVINGDATDEYNMDKACIDRAKGVVCALGKNEDNFFLVLTAKHMKPDIMVVSRAESVKVAKKMEAAGADEVVTPEVISGRKMADKIVKP